MLALLAIVFLTWLVFGYFAYGRWIAKQFKLNDERETPANRVNDGEDFIPTKPFYLFGQHFSAIAAAGPIAGPIIACQAFGWLPCLLWIAFGRGFDRRGSRFFDSYFFRSTRREFDCRNYEREIGNRRGARDDDFYLDCARLRHRRFYGYYRRNVCFGRRIFNRRDAL
jgi:hypothetical protein